MKKNKNLIAGIIFFLVSISLIFLSWGRFMIFPTQEVSLSYDADFGKVLPGTVFIQEVTLKRDYLDRIDIYFGNINTDGQNEIAVLVTDENGKLLLTTRMNSKVVEKADYYPFVLNNPVRIGAGKKIFVCLNSIDGTPSNCLTVPLNKKSMFGKFSVALIQNNDLIETIRNPKQITTLEGSIGVKTHEISHPFLNMSTFLLSIVFVLISLLIIFFPLISPYLKSITPNPGYAFVTIACIFGTISLYITPPFQTPDEPVHFYRAFEISELNFSRSPDEVPASLKSIASTGERMKFKSWEKTNSEEIRKTFSTKLDRKNRTYAETVDFTLPYLPQAFGIALTRLFSDAPLWYLYIARLINLVFSILLIFLAIRLTPVHKWVFFLLGLMPMTISQIASASYDASTISLSMLLFAWILRLAFGKKDLIIRRDYLLLFVLTLILALSKPPYFLVGMSFLIIPVSRIGSLKRFILIASALFLSSVVVSQFGSSASSALQSLFISSANAGPVSSVVSAVPAPETNVTHADAQTAAANISSGPAAQESPKDSGQQSTSVTGAPNAQPLPAASSYDAVAQKNFILDDPLRYLAILLNSIAVYFGLYMTSFVGLFGWNDTALPDLLVFLFLFTLISTASIDSNNNIKISVKRKLILATIFLTCFVLIETGLYLYSNFVGTRLIVGVQGRYFIPLAPMLFILFYQSRFSAFPDRLFTRSVGHSRDARPKTSSRKNRAPANAKTKVDAAKKTASTHPHAESDSLPAHQTKDTPKTVIFRNHFLPWILISVVVIELGNSIIMILNRFYIITW